MLRSLCLVCFVAFAASCIGCVRVPPHKRETLAKPALQAAPWPDVERSNVHVFEVREGSTGATGNPGGGCGCN